MAGTTKPAEHAICLGVMMERFIYGDPVSVNQMVELTGYHIDTIKKYIGVLHRKKVIYICEWHRGGLNGHYRPYYTICLNKLQRDVERPPYLTNAERQKNRRDKVRAAKKEAELLKQMMDTI